MHLILRFMTRLLDFHVLVPSRPTPNLQLLKISPKTRHFRLKCKAVHQPALQNYSKSHMSKYDPSTDIIHNLDTYMASIDKTKAKITQKDEVRLQLPWGSGNTMSTVANANYQS